jgi:sirohydrochlorin cobaltochelatase
MSVEGSSGAGAHALLIAAHGERRDGADNEGPKRLVAMLARERLADEIAFGLIAGQPSIEAAIGQFRTRRILVYPFMLAPGWFARVRLRQLVEAALAGRTAWFLDPLGVDPSLADTIAIRAADAARSSGITPARASLVLLTHGSGTDPASRNAAENVADRLRARGRFGGIGVAVLEGGPGFAATIASVRGPVLVVGLFAGEGLHGAGDVPSLIGGSPNAIFVGNVGGWPEIADLVAAAVRRAIAGNQAEVCSAELTGNAPVFGASKP